MQFLEWLLAEKKQKKKPNYWVDDFLKEVDALKKDLASLANQLHRKKKKNDSRSIDAPTKIADLVYQRLNSDPRFYDRASKIMALSGFDGSPKIRVTRHDAKNIAQSIGIDFAKESFTPEAFRKALEFEINQDNWEDNPMSPNNSDNDDRNRDPMGLVDRRSERS